jgi:hypothetical protein
VGELNRHLSHCLESLCALQLLVGSGEFLLKTMCFGLEVRVRVLQRFEALLKTSKAC